MTYFENHKLLELYRIQNSIDKDGLSLQHVGWGERNEPRHLSVYSNLQPLIVGVRASPQPTNFLKSMTLIIVKELFTLVDVLT